MAGQLEGSVAFITGAAKHGVVGLMRSCANQLAEHSIRVNTIHPTGVNTPMVVNDGRYVTGVTLPVDAGFLNQR